MANMSSSDRAQYERPELSAADRSMRVTNRRPVIAFTALSLVILAALVYAVAWGIDGWPHALRSEGTRLNSSHSSPSRMPSSA